jgi:hypothetical protein
VRITLEPAPPEAVLWTITPVDGNDAEEISGA